LTSLQEQSIPWENKKNIKVVDLVVDFIRKTFHYLAENSKKKRKRKRTMKNNFKEDFKYRIRVIPIKVKTPTLVLHEVCKED